MAQPPTSWSIGRWVEPGLNVGEGAFLLGAPLKTKMTGWEITIFNRRYIFKWLFFHCHVSFWGCRWFTSRVTNPFISMEDEVVNAKFQVHKVFRDFCGRQFLFLWRKRLLLISVSSTSLKRACFFLNFGNFLG